MNDFIFVGGYYINRKEILHFSEWTSGDKQKNTTVVFINGKYLELQLEVKDFIKKLEAS